jgi:hypothetical protein
MGSQHFKFFERSHGTIATRGREARLLMEFFPLCLFLLSITASALAVDKEELDQRIRDLTVNFEVLQAKPGKMSAGVRILDFSGVGVLDDLTRRMRRGQNGVRTLAKWPVGGRNSVSELSR